MKRQAVVHGNASDGIQSNLIYLVTSCTTPKDLWDTLKAQFERNTLANENKLFIKR